METEFKDFPKIARLSRDCIVTEKIDGSNSQIMISEGGEILAGSRSRWITPKEDNFGFAAWVEEHREDLLKMGPGRHFGEWYGSGIQRGYNLKQRRLALFNVKRWETDRPAGCDIVPVLAEGMFDELNYKQIMADLLKTGSRISPGFMKPEGIVIWHVAGNFGLKKTFEKDAEWKGKK